MPDATGTYLDIGLLGSQFLLNLCGLTLQVVRLLLLRPITLLERRQRSPSLFQSSLHTRSLLRQSITLRGSNIDQGLLLVDLGCPGFKFSLLGIDLYRKLVGLVCKVNIVTMS